MTLNNFANGSSDRAPHFRAPRRVTITIPWSTYSDLLLRADHQGRSLSSLAAFLLELQLQSLACSSAPAAPAPRALRSETRRCA